jgi:hypothetical protein
MPSRIDTGEMPEPPEWAEPVPAGIKQVERWKTETPETKKAEVPPEKPKLVALKPKSGSEIEQFREKCKAAGITDDKPLSLLMETLFDAAVTAKDAVQDGARGLTQDGEADLIKRIARHADASMRDAAAKHRLRLERKASLIAGVVVVVSLVLGATGGYWYGWSSGRNSVETVQREISAAFQSGPDGASVWLRLMRNNDPRKALDHCTGSAVWSSDDRHACSIPLWIDGPGAPEANNK